MTSGDSGDSLPPLEFLDRSEKEELGPGDLVQLVDLQMVELNLQQGYVQRLSPAMGHKEERVEVAFRVVRLTLRAENLSLSKSQH